MSQTPVDFALIQPLVYSLTSWMDLRTALATLADEDGFEAARIPGARLHRERRDEWMFDRSLESAASLPDAFTEVLSQTRAYPCVVVPVDEPAEALHTAPEIWPAGLAIESAATWFILPRNGELCLLYLATGSLAEGALGDPSRHLQREVREMFMAAIDRAATSLGGTLEGIVHRAVSGRPTEGVADVLERSGGHLVTFLRSADPGIVEALGRVHRIEEGSAQNHRSTLFPDDPDEPCYLHLGWSYSTVATRRIELSYRLLFPLVAVNQAWYRYRELRGDVIDMSKAVDALETDSELRQQTDFYNRVVLQVRIWEAEREAYERGLKPVYRSAYDTLWDYWDTDESKATVHDGTDVTRDFLDRKFNLKIALRENTQSRILFVIAIFQLLSVFGLISGYLYFWEETRLPEGAIFGSEVTVWVTLLSPIVVLVLIVWLLVGFLRRNR